MDKTIETTNTEFVGPQKTTEEQKNIFEKAFSGGLYLALCIVSTVAAALSFTSGAVDIVSILVCIGIWLTYGYAKKGVLSNKVSHLDLIRVPLLIKQILLIVLAIFIAVTGLIAIASTLISATFINELYSLLDQALSELVNEFIPELAPYAQPIIEMLFGVTGIGAVITLVVTIIASLVLILFSILFNGAALSAVKNFKCMLKNQKFKLRTFKTMRIWLIVMGVVNCLTADFLSAAAMIIAFVFAGQLIDTLKKDGIG